MKNEIGNKWEEGRGGESEGKWREESGRMRMEEIRGRGRIWEEGQGGN